MQMNLMRERDAYEQTKHRLAQLQKRIKKMRRKNIREAKTQKKIDFLINNDF